MVQLCMGWFSILVCTMIAATCCTRSQYPSMFNENACGCACACARDWRTMRVRQCFYSANNVFVYSSRVLENRWIMVLVYVHQYLDSSRKPNQVSRGFALPNRLEAPRNRQFFPCNDFTFDDAASSNRGQIDSRLNWLKNNHANRQIKAREWFSATNKVKANPWPVVI